MAIHPEVRDHAYRLFMQEAPELLQAIETELLLLRHERTRARVHTLMRAAHSIKGGAGNVGLPVIHTLAHRLEDCFRALYHEELAVDIGLEHALLQGYDCLKAPLLEVIEHGDLLDGEAALATAEPIFTGIEAQLGEFLQGEDQLPTVAEMGIDIAQNIFEVDVARALDRLEVLALNPSDPTLVGELRAQAEVFIGIAELLELGGLKEIAQLTLQGLDDRPEQAAELVKVALADFRAAQQAVLHGDRNRGGEPSEALRALLVADPASVGDRDTLFEGGGEDSAGFDLLSEPDLESESTALDFWDSLQEQETAPPVLETLDLADIFENSLINTVEPTASDSPLDHVSELELEDPISSFSLEEVFGLEEEADPTSLANDDEYGIEIELGSVEETVESLSLEDIFGSPISAEQDRIVEQTSPVEPLSFPEPSASNDLDLVAYLKKESESSTLLETISAVESVFESLPPSPQPSLEPEPEVVSPQTPEPVPLHPASVAMPKSTDPTAALTVRLELNRLERMNNQLGELAINRNSLSLHNDQLRARLRELLTRFGQFRNLGLQLRSLLEKMLIAPERYVRDRALSLSRTERGAEPIGSQLAGLLLLQETSQFDSLELDIYSDVYTLLQTALDSIQQLEETVEDVKLFSDRSDRDLNQQRHLMTQLRNELMWSRMLPIGDSLNRFPRLLRDLSYEYSKPVDLQLVGTSVLVDKVVLDKLTDPLIHLVRNAFDHGIEKPEIRQENGKPGQGRIWIRTSYRGNRTVIEVEDDGKGIDLDRVRARAVQLGMFSEEAARQLSTQRVLDLLFEPGFSTATQVSKLSGRGVGLDIVRSQIRALKGSIAIRSEPNRGTCFTLQIPLTLSVAKLLVVWTGTSTVALPSDSLEEIVIPKPQDLKSSRDRQYLQWRERLVPIHTLSELLPYSYTSPSLLPNLALGSVPSPAHWSLPIVVLQQGEQVFGLRVERLITEQELVIKPLSTVLPSPRYLFGCTIMGDGSLIPVIDGFMLIGRWQEQPRPPQFPQPVAPASTTPTLLIVDDSAGMRQTLTATLEKAGYRVLKARDGKEALQQLHNARVELVICDIEMPVMNGFEFLTHRRQDPQLNQVPVVMLTSRSSSKHKQLCTHLGAVDYFTKPYVEQTLLSRLSALLGES